MATYHLSAKTISRSHGRSATGAAAYRTGARIIDERTGVLHDYQRRRGVEAVFLLLPANAPDWACDRARLWNAAEQAETRKNSTVAREFEIALPAELDAEQRQRLTVDFARELVERHGCAADVAIHQPSREGDSRNHHAHILLSTRRLAAAGFTEKTRELDDLKTGEIGRWRERFAEVQNARLREAGVEARVDHRSLEAQEIDREATIHLGPTATALERRGVPTRLGESNREVQASHAERQRDAEARREAEQKQQAEPPAAEAEARAPVQENIIQALREKTAWLYQRAMLPPFEDEAFAEPPPARPPSLPETTEAERQRRTDEPVPAQRQQEAERQGLLRADIPTLEREWSEWTRHQEWLARHESPPASGLADQWGELARAKRAATAAEQALNALDAAYADWRQVHKLGLLLMVGLPGSKRREVPAWEQRITAARATLEQAQAALAVAQEAYNTRLPAAEREARQLAEDGRRQLATLQGRIKERAGLIQRAKAAQEAERERLNAEARARAEAERQQREVEQREVEQRKTQEPEHPPAEPPAPKQEPPKWAIPTPRPKPRYPAPGG